MNMTHISWFVNPKDLRVWWYRRKARTHYMRYMDIFDNMDCGHEMCKHISLRASRHARCFNSYMEKLEALGDVFGDITGYRL